MCKLSVARNYSAKAVNYSERYTTSAMQSYSSPSLKNSVKFCLFTSATQAGTANYVMALTRQINATRHSQLTIKAPANGICVSRRLHIFANITNK